MKKITASVFFLIAIHSSCYTQNSKYFDSLSLEWHKNIMHGLDTAKQDTDRVLLTVELANYYKFNLPDSALFFGYKALTLARQIKFPKGEAGAMMYMAMAQITLGNDSKALEINLKGLKVAEKNNLADEKAILLNHLGIINNRVENHAKALKFLKESKTLCDSIHDFVLSAYVQKLIGETYLMLHQIDSALYYCQSAYKNAVHLHDNWATREALLTLGKIQDEEGNVDLALAYFRQSLSRSDDAESFFTSYFSMAQLYSQINKPDSGIYYANKSLEIVQGKGFYSHIIDANILLSGIYEKRDLQKALQYNKIAIAYKDSLNNLGKATSFENFIAFDAQERQYEIDTANTSYRNQFRQYVLIASLGFILVIAFILYRNNRRKQKSKVKIEKAYAELKSTQAQLIQSEKMASLGELTAGIAHEIQNPLNFVNNFSEVNSELISEMVDEVDKGNTEEVKAIANDIKQNLEKINHHGKRADAIVKGMLQHSRSSTNVKEPTDINKLADEYLRLTYHGLRAKDNSFNATMKTDYDESIGKINIVPQDIGRVLLNLYNNAFYAVTEKKKQQPEGYEPTISVSTKKINDKVEISVKDNGNGIPQKVIDKIFQPFFTTKPTGQGTGLGLSLSYDVIKAHGGEIKVQTKDGEGAEFIIYLQL